MSGASQHNRTRSSGSGLRVVVFGATGNIGTALVRALGRDPAVSSVLGVARRLPAWKAPKTAWATADIRVDDLAPLLGDTDVVVHLAWAFQPTHDPEATWRVNAVGSQRLFEAAAAAAVPALVYASSVGAYSPGPKTSGVDESWPTDSLSTAAYGREKAYVERALDAVESRHPELRVVRLRPAFVFQRAAASEQWRIFAGSVIPSVVASRRFVPVVPRTDGLRFQAVHADDAADAFRRAICMPVRGAFNIAAEPVVGSAELGRVFRATVVPVPRAVLRAGLAVAWHLRLSASSPQLLDLALSLPIMDTGRALRELGWRPRFSSIDALSELAEGLRHRSGAPTAPLAAPR